MNAISVLESGNPVPLVDFCGKLAFSRGPFTAHGLSYCQTLGAGAFGLVFEGKKTIDGVTKKFAVKCQKITQKTPNPECDRYVLREKQALDLILNKGGHPSIVQYYDHVLGGYTLPGSSETLWYIAMSFELAPFGDLQCYRERLFKESNIRQFTPGETLHVVNTVSDALTFMKTTCNLAHRDLKLANLLVFSATFVGQRRRVDVKIADVGMARTLLGGETNLTHVGTPGYHAPEIQDFGEKNENGAGYPGDVWSLGVIALQLLICKSISSSPTGADIQRIVHTVKNTWKNKLNPSLTRLLVNMLEIKKEDRIEIEDVSQELASIAANEYGGDFLNEKKIDASRGVFQQQVQSQPHQSIFQQQMQSQSQSSQHEFQITFSQLQPGIHSNEKSGSQPAASIKNSQQHEKTHFTLTQKAAERIRQNPGLFTSLGVALSWSDATTLVLEGPTVVVNAIRNTIQCLVMQSLGA